MNMIKKTIIALALAVATFFGASEVKAQKFAYIDFQELMKLMPEYKRANTVMEAFNDTLRTEQERLYAEYEKAVKWYQKNGAGLSEAIKSVKEGEIRDMESRIRAFQESAQDEMRNKETELLKPIIEKAKAAIASVAKEGGYTYVFDSSPGTPLLYKPDGDNIMAAVKKKMNIL